MGAAMNGHGITAIGGRERSLLRHLQRRREQTRDELLEHFVDGAHSWWPEDVDRCLARLVEVGYVCPADQRGLYRPTVVPPL
jgi:hypothetical protein